MVPAQEAALNWLEETMTVDQAVYRIGGHSKGGNLAIYASAMCADKYKEKVISIYNNDGPGICREVQDKEKFEKIRNKIIRVIPGFCIIGKLFEPDIPPIIVESKAKGILQHDIMTWQLSGDQLCVRQEPEPGSEFYNDIFDTWIESADMKQREIFTRDFFGALRAGGAQTIPQIAEGGLDGFGTVLVSIVESESRTKIVIGKFLKSCMSQLRQVNIKHLIKSKEGLRANIALAAGFICMSVPQLAVGSIGILLSLLGLLWSGRKILEYGVHIEMDVREKKRRILCCMGVMCLMVFLITHHKVIVISGNILIGLLFIGASFRLFQSASKERMKKWKQKGTIASGILVFLLGCVSIVTPEAVFAGKMIFIGSCLIIYGLVTYLRAIFGKALTERSEA